MRAPAFSTTRNCECCGASADDLGTFGTAVRVLLLTGQRLSKVLTMRHDDIKDGIWHIATEKREKGNAGTLPLPLLALAIIRAQPRFIGNPYVLPGRGESPYGGSSPNSNVSTYIKQQLDQRSGITGLVLHDLRRTARSLMSRAGVLPHISERSSVTSWAASKGSTIATNTSAPETV